MTKPPSEFAQYCGDLPTAVGPFLRPGGLIQEPERQRNKFQRSKP